MRGFFSVTSLAAGVILAGCSGQADGAAVHRNSGALDMLMQNNANPPEDGRPQVALSSSAPGRRADSPAEAQGRRTLSAAFVMMGAGEHLTVTLRDGRTIVLREVVMQPRDYCGVQVLGGSASARFCGGYADVAAARPVGRPAPDEPSVSEDRGSLG